MPSEHELDWLQIKIDCRKRLCRRDPVDAVAWPFRQCPSLTFLADECGRCSCHFLTRDRLKSSQTAKDLLIAKLYPEYPKLSQILALFRR